MFDITDLINLTHGKRKPVIPLRSDTGTTFDTIFLRSHREEILSIFLAFKQTEQLLDSMEEHTIAKHFEILLRMLQHRRQLRQLKEWLVHDGIGATGDEREIRWMCRMCQAIYEGIRRRMGMGRKWGMTAGF